MVKLRYCALKETHHLGYGCLPIFLNLDMMEKYKENNINKDLFYEEQKREKVKAAREEVLRKKKEEAAKKTLEDVSSESKEEKLLEDTPADVKHENDPEVDYNKNARFYKPPGDLGIELDCYKYKRYNIQAEDEFEDLDIFQEDETIEE